MQLTKVQFVENRGLVFWMHDCMVYMCLFCPEHGKKLRGFTHRAGWWVWARYRWHLHKLWSSSWGLSSWYIPRLAIGWQNFLSWYWFARLQSLQFYFVGHLFTFPITQLREGGCLRPHNLISEEFCLLEIIQ